MSYRSIALFSFLSEVMDAFLFLRLILDMRQDPYPIPQSQKPLIYIPR